MSFLTIPVTDIRERIRAVLDSLDKPVFVTQRGRVRAVLMHIDAYNSLMDELDDARLAADPAIRWAMAEADAAAGQGDTIPIEDVLREYGLPGHSAPAGKEAA